MGEQLLVLLGVLLFVALIIVVAIASKRAQEAHRARLAAFAAERGLQYSPFGIAGEPGGCLGAFSPYRQAEQQYLALFSGFQPFGVGTMQTVRNRIWGRWNDLDWEIFDYAYTVSSGKHSTTYRYAIIAAQCDFMVPEIDIRRENFFDRIGSWVGIRDMQFESIEFNEAFHVKSQDEKRTYDLIHPAAIDFLMNCWVPQWQLAGRTVLLIENDTLNVPSMVRFMDTICEFICLVPDYYRHDNGIARA